MSIDLEDSLFQVYQQNKPELTPEADEIRLRYKKTRELFLANPPPKEPGGYLLILKRHGQPFWQQLTAITHIGRCPEGMEIVLRHPWVSRSHCTISLQNGEWEMVDSGSRNGCKINGQKKDRHILREGDAIHIGAYLLLFIKIEIPFPQ